MFKKNIWSSNILTLNVPGEGIPEMRCALLYILNMHSTIFVFDVQFINYNWFALFIHLYSFIRSDMVFFGVFCVFFSIANWTSCRHESYTYKYIFKLLQVFSRSSFCLTILRKKGEGLFPFDFTFIWVRIVIFFSFFRILT